MHARCDGSRALDGGVTVDAQSGKPVGIAAGSGQAMVEQQGPAVRELLCLNGRFMRPVSIGICKEARREAMPSQPHICAKHLGSLILP